VYKAFALLRGTFSWDYGRLSFSGLDRVLAFRFRINGYKNGFQQQLKKEVNTDNGPLVFLSFCFGRYWIVLVS
jgi:hypothetical protein